jgi:hypothetical protein
MKNCQACKETLDLREPPLNDKGLCDRCFLKEAHQRLLYALSNETDADITVWANWFLDHYRECYEEWG